MIDKNHIRAGLAVFLALAVPGAQAASSLELAGSKAVCSGLFDVGARKVEVTGSSEKFSEYRDMRDGVLVNEVLLSVQGSDKPYFFDFEARNAVRGFLTPASRDARFGVAAGRYGKYKLSAVVDRTPHNFGEGKSLLSGVGTGSLSITDSIQTRLQALEQTRAERGGVALTDTTGEDAQQRAIVLGLLDAAGPTVFSLDREKGTLAGEFDLSSDAKTWVKFSEEKRKGFRQIGVGTYERVPQGATAPTHYEDQFITEGIEIAEPIDYKTQSVNAGFGVYKKSWSADLEYTFTEFTQRLASLVWENPFRATDAGARNATDTADNNAFDRGRFNRGQLSLPPTSQSHEVNASGSVELPLASRLTAAVGTGLTRQNNMLLPYTLNGALAQNTGGPTNITDPSALLVSRFNGEVRTMTGSLVLASRPMDKLRTALKYRYYDYANRSDVILFPGYAAFGESFWRAFKNDTDNRDAQVQNEPASYTRQTGEVSADYELLEPLTVDAGAFYDLWDYRRNRVDKTDEYGANAGFAYHVGHAAKVHGGYKFARRTVTGYRAGNQDYNPEAIGLQNYNWADRKRHKATLGVGVTPTETLSFGLDAAYQQDELGANDRFGLKDVKSAVAAFDATYEPSEKFALSFDYSREVRRSKMQNAAKDDKFNSTSAVDDDYINDPFSPMNYWNDAITENVDTIGLEATVRPQEKLDVTAGYSFSLSRMDFSATNPNAAESVAAGYDATKLKNGIAQTWPSVVSRLHEVRVGAGYQLLKDLKIGGNYLYSRYSLNDFANTGSYLPGSSPENTTKYVFAGANQLGYTAHVVGTYVAWKF